ncbi:hypothetical protein FGO68_gene7676 [Halteria grandinella]|uniref:Uncharacterized protein n=1 Tax=Halteria grandinella TaxID=5974 RepID=A0A8J8NZN3_HALGN|nr:hypothetical protein FGO68_gene7676 [Halteria grandinella]
MDILKQQQAKQQQQQLFQHKSSTPFTFLCDYERQKTLQSNHQLSKDKVLTVQLLTRSSFSKKNEQTYRFLVTHQHLDTSNFTGILNESKLKLSKRELRKQLIIQFEFPQIRRIYANQMAQGKLSMVIAEEDTPLESVKTFKLFIHGADFDTLKLFCKEMERLMGERKAKIEQREQEGKEALEKKREAKLRQRNAHVLEKQNAVIPELASQLSHVTVEIEPTQRYSMEEEMPRNQPVRNLGKMRVK